VLPLSYDTKIFLKILKYCIKPNKEMATPVINKKLKSFFQALWLTKRVKKMARMKKNNKFKIPPVLVGEPKTLRLGSCENMVDKISVIKKAERIKNGR